jgi:hypothetical protein
VRRWLPCRRKPYDIPFPYDIFPTLASTVATMWKPNRGSTFRKGFPFSGLGPIRKHASRGQSAGGSPGGPTRHRRSAPLRSTSTPSGRQLVPTRFPLYVPIVPRLTPDADSGFLIFLEGVGVFSSRRSLPQRKYLPGKIWRLDFSSPLSILGPCLSLSHSPLFRRKVLGCVWLDMKTRSR